MATKPGFVPWFRKLVGTWRPDPVQLKLSPPAGKCAPRKLTSEELPGNYHFFEAFLEITLGGQTYLALPKQALLNTLKTPPVLLWGTPIKFSFPNPAMPRVRWTDDPKKGLTGRIITAPEDVLGAEGLFGNKKYRFEKTLQTTKNEVVYSLVCDENQTRIAYSLPRDPLRAEKPAAKMVN